MFNVTEMFACRISSCTTFTSSPFPFEERRVRMAERVPAEVAHDSDFLGRRFQVRLVERPRPVRQFAFAVWAGEYPVLVDWVWTLQSPVPQNFGQSQIEWNRLARGLGLAVPNVLHDDRANDMDLHLLKIDVLPLEA